jgi:hypothetical protein
MNVYLTIDTESSMAGAWRSRQRRPLKADRHIFCRIGGEDYGIGLVTRRLSEYGFRATHFVETLATLVNGSDDTRIVFDYLLEHGQDVQLHAHPTYHFYAEALRAWDAGRQYAPPPDSDLIRSFDEPRQLELLEEAAALFRRFAGYRPFAFRAGCFAADYATLRGLRKLGIAVDSSFNPCYPDLSFPGTRLQPNRLCRVEGVWEIPVTVARTPLPECDTGLKHADASALSFAEIRAMLRAAAERGQSHFVLLFHSFSAVKPKDETYRRIRPDRVVIRRVSRLLRYLAENSKMYRVSTFADLAGELSAIREEEAPVTDLGLFTAGLRKSVQALNRWYWL